MQKKLQSLLSSYIDLFIKKDIKTLNPKELSQYRAALSLYAKLDDSPPTQKDKKVWIIERANMLGWTDQQWSDKAGVSRRTLHSYKNSDVKELTKNKIEKPVIDATLP